MAITSLAKILVYERTDDVDLLPLESATTALGASSTSIATAIAIGFTFRFAGADYTAIDLCARGFVRFAGTETSATNANLFAANTSVLIAPWWDDIATADSVGYVQYETQGTAPFRRFVVEWYVKLNSAQTATDCDRAKMQLVLYETMDKHEVRYGELGVLGSPSRGSYGASRGCKGNTGVDTSNYLDYEGSTRALGASDTTATTTLAAPVDWPTSTIKCEPNWPMPARYVEIPASSLTGLQHPECEPVWAIAASVNALRCLFTPPLVNVAPTESGNPSNPIITVPITPSADGRTYRVWIETYGGGGGAISCTVGEDAAADPQPVTDADWSTLATPSEGVTSTYRSWSSFTVSIDPSSVALRFKFAGTALIVNSIMVAPEPLTDFDPTTTLASGWQWMGLGQLRQQGAAVHAEWYNRAWRNVERLLSDLKQVAFSWASRSAGDVLVSGTTAAPARVIATAPCCLAGWRGQSVTVRVMAYDTSNGGKLAIGERAGRVTSDLTIDTNGSEYRIQSTSLQLVSDEPHLFATAYPAGSMYIAAVVAEWTPALSTDDLIRGTTPAPRLEYLLRLVSRIKRAWLTGWAMTGLATYLSHAGGGWRCAWMIPPGTAALRVRVARLSKGTGSATYTSVYGASSGSGSNDEVRIEPPNTTGTDSWPPDLGPVAVASTSDRYDDVPGAPSDRLLESPTEASMAGGTRELVTIQRGVGATLVPLPVDPATI